VWLRSVLLVFVGEAALAQLARELNTQFATSLTVTGTRMPYAIAPCYLSPGRADISAKAIKYSRFNSFVSAFTLAKLVLDLATPERCKTKLT